MTNEERLKEILAITDRIGLLKSQLAEAEAELMKLIARRVRKS